MLLHRVKQVRASLECTHHTGCGLMEHPVGDMIKQMALELKIDNKVDVSLVRNRRECPVIG